MWTQSEVAFLPAYPPAPYPGCDSRCGGIREGIVCAVQRSGSVASSTSSFRGRPPITFVSSNTPSKRARRRRIRVVPSCQLNLNDLESVRARAAALGTNVRRFLQSSTGQLFVWGMLFWLLISGQIGWILQSFLFLLFMFSVVPVLGILALRFWLNRQLVQGSCPSCGASVTGLKGRSFQCMSCGQAIQVDASGNFGVNDPATATIDIDAKRID